MRRRYAGLLELHGAVFLFGLAGLFGKFLDLPPFLIVFGRTVFASLALVFVLLIRGELPKIHSRRDLGWIVLSGVVLALHWTTFFSAVQVSTVAVGLMAFSSFPLFVTFLEPWVSGTSLRASDLISASLVLAGLLLVVPDFDLGDHVTRGVCWGTLSGLAFAVLSLINKRLVGTYPPMTLAAGQDLVAAVALLPLLPGQARWPGVRDLILLAVLGVGCTALAHTLFIKGLAHVRAHVAAVVTGLEPVYGILFALLMLGEVPARRTLLGGGLILAAITLASVRRGREQERDGAAATSTPTGTPFNVW